MRDPRLTGGPPPSPPAALVLAAHGSSDPRFAEVVEAIAEQLRGARPGLDVRIGYLDHGPPSLADVVDGSSVVVPLLLSRGYHVHVDIPDQAAGCVVTEAIGADPLLAAALADRLAEAGWDAHSPVVLAGAGSSDERALDDVRAVAAVLRTTLGVEVTTAFVSAGSPRLSEIDAGVVSSYLLAPGVFHDAVVETGASVTSAPIGAHPAVAEIVLARYEAAGDNPRSSVVP